VTVAQFQKLGWLTGFVGSGRAECELWTVIDLNIISELVLMELLPVLSSSLISNA
jgi:hypothetical protein